MISVIVTFTAYGSKGKEYTVDTQNLGKFIFKVS